MSRLLTDIACLRELAASIESDDGVAQAALAEIADRLERMEMHIHGVTYWHARMVSHPDSVVSPPELARHVQGLREVCA